MGLKEGGYVKKIVKAWIQQIIEFDSEEEYNKYADEISKNGKKWDASLLIDEKTGKVTATVRKQYNNNTFPDDEKEGEESV
jgi:hypothetical protein